MTNRDKFLKVGVDVDGLSKQIATHLIPYYKLSDTTKVYEDLVNFFRKTIKPQLTEDERVILRNIKGDCKYVGRKYDNERKYNEGILYICARTSSSVEYKYLGCYNHLFQFIKERRRILY